MTVFAARLAIITLATIPLLASTPHAAHAVACGTDSDTCAATNSSIQAIAHSFNSPETEVLFRARIPAWSPANTKWGDLENGFFYRVTRSTGSTLVYTPFNGIAIGSNGLPQLPSFTFIVPVESAAAASFTIEACVSERTFASGQDPDCKVSFWSDTFGPLPVPRQTDPPPVSITFGTLTLDQSSIVVADSGVYSAQIVMTVETFGGALTQDQIDWLNDHLAFFDRQGNVITNDIYGSTPLGVLTFEDAAYLNPGDREYYTKYTSPDGNPVNLQASPDQTFFIYATSSLPAATTIGVTVIYDASADCTGILPNSGTKNPNCTTESVTTGNPDISPAFQVTASDFSPVNNATAEQAPGQVRQRIIELGLSPTSTECTEVVNPLGLNSANAYGPPNYLIGDGVRFPKGLYYVVAAGFGTCDLSKEAPFCDQTPNYVAYVPHYQDRNSLGGPLNGGGTENRVVARFALADKYAITGTSGQNAQNSVVFFDNCGYWFTYTEPNSLVSSLDTRLSLPAAPKGYTALTYTIQNQTGRAVVFGKECCASWYQPDSQTNENEPTQQLDDGFGMFLPEDSDASYDTFFREESIAIYDAATGQPLFKMLLKGSNTILHSCADPSASVVVSGTDIKLGATGSGAKKCQSIGQCPIGMTAAQSGSLVTCTRTDSSFLFGIDDWKDQVSLPNAIQLRAYGGTGHKGPQGGPDPGGAHGFALTVLRPTDLVSAYYAYVGTNGSQNGDGGSSTILTRTPLSFYGQDVAEATTNPDNMNVMLIAGGGGGAGTKHDGGNGGAALANSSSLPGRAVGAHGADGMNDNGGEGGGKGSAGAGGSTAGKDGVGGTSHGTSADWDKTGPLIPPTVDPLDWTNAGHGAHGNGCAGGGGFGGGGHGSTNAAGCGGGGSWATGNTAYDSTAPTGRPSSPNGENGAVQIAYVKPAAAVAPGAAATDGSTRNVVRLTFDTSVVPLHFPVVIERIFGTEITGDVPVYIEAWGGAGGAGGAEGGSGGTSGYARASYLLADLLAMNTGDGLYLYVGEPGVDGEKLGEAGQGGASSIVGTQPIAEGAAAPRDRGVLLVSGGGGGGGAGSTTDDPTAQPGGGGAGGAAIATLEADASSGGADGDAVVDGEEAGGRGGNGSGGSAGADGGSQGGSGVGGFGGTTGANPSVPHWLDADIASWNAGTGAASSTLGGGGGGGFGGGGSGGQVASRGEGGGGGGGGSWARQSTVAEGDAPVLGPLNPSATNGAITLTFDVCKVRPESRYCSADANFAEIHPQVRTFDDGDGLLRVRVEGSDSLDVAVIDVRRFLFGHTMVEPVQVSEPADASGDGLPDLELLIEASNLATGPAEVVHCLYGALGDSTPFVGCSRVEAAACDACPREECINDVCGGCVDEPCFEETPTSRDDDDSCAIVSGSRAKSQEGRLLLLFFGVVLVAARRRAMRSSRNPGRSFVQSPVS